MAALPPKAEHEDFPVACQAFIARLKGTADEVWSKLMTARFGQKKFLFSEWRAALAALKKGE